MATKLVEEDQVDVVFGGIYSSTRQAIKGPVVVEGKTLYIYPEQYEGQESDPLIFCTGPVPAQQVDPFIPWLMRETGAKRFYLPSADYIWPRVMNARVREVVTANGGSIVGEEYFPLDHEDYRATVERIAATGADVVFNTTVPPGRRAVPRAAPRFRLLRRGGQLVCTYFEENFLDMVPAAHVEGALQLPRLLPRGRAIRSARSCSRSTTRSTPVARSSPAAAGARACTAGCGSGPPPSPRRARSTQDDVIAALDHAQIAEGPGGPAAMVPGQHHVRMHMYIGQARDGRFEVVESLGAKDPQERPVDAHVVTA